MKESGEFNASCGRLRKRRMGAIIVLALCVSGVTAGVAFGEGNAVRLAENADGLTYGAVRDAEASGQYLDLVKVQATNGKIGYVYNKDLVQAETHGVKTAADAERVMTECQEASNEALAEELTALLPEGEVTADEAASYLDELLRCPLNGSMGDSTQVREKSALTALANESDIEEVVLARDIEEAMYAAEQKVKTLIPVYDADGKTEIGEFAVGSLM